MFVTITTPPPYLIRKSDVISWMQYGSPHKNIVGYTIHAASRFTFSFQTLFSMVQYQVKANSFLCTPQKHM